jgi:hypothetical protein
MRGGSRFSITMLLLLLPKMGLSETACLTTLPPSTPFTPSRQYESVRVEPDGFWYGTDALWTQLVVDGTWYTTGNVDKNGGYAAKLVFWSQEFDWRKGPEPGFILTARRVDADSPSFANAGAGPVFIQGKPAMMTGIHIPTAGCWQISAHYKGHVLTFTTLVKPYDTQTMQ